MGIFEPFRAIGYITSSVPFSVQKLGTETFVTVSVGKAWQIYNCAKLNLVLVGPQLPKKIRALASYRDYTFAAYGNKIAVFKRAHQVATWSSHSAKVNLLYLFGDHILSVDADHHMFIWAFKGIQQNLEPLSHIFLEGKFSPTCIVHPDTYLNKVIFGSQEGNLQLWNVNTKKNLYDFKGWNSPISCCVSSPALDVVAVGCADGKIHIHNIRYDEELVTFEHSMRGAVTALSFSTDGQPLLASGGTSGVISVWNLEKRRLQSVIREAHDGAIISLHFFANEPVLMSSSADNSIKMWIFDTTDGDPRLLRFRNGHSAPPLCIRFYANGRHILSAGQDRAFRLFSVVQDQQSRELSQRHVTKRAKKLRVKAEEIKLKPVVAFDCAEIRERDWCNVVTCHMDTTKAYVWRLQNFVLGEHILNPSDENQTPIKACTISACGNFAVLGTAGGWIERFNLQSGLSRGSYLDKSERRSCGHDGEVVGVACDSTNTLMISAGYHGDIKVWNFRGRELKSRWEVGYPVVKIVYHRPNGLLATVADDLVIRIYDVVALRMVRKFEGHKDRVTDMCFSEDGKWLLSSSMDGTLRIWDVILARQIDAIQVDVAITALSLSPNMDVLATTHVDQNGVYLWVNQAMFTGSSSIDSYASGKDILHVKLPSISAAEGNKGTDVEEGDTKNSLVQESSTVPKFDQTMPDLITLSLLPKTQWQSLINLDVIKVRNKPIEPPKKPENAPFFLPSIPSLSGDIMFKASEVANEELKDGDTEHNLDYTTGLPPSPFVQVLQSAVESKNFSAFTHYIKGLSPSSLDMELRMLQIIDDDESLEPSKRPEMLSLDMLLDYFIHEISCRHNFEFMQAVVRLFLKIHGETVRCQLELQEKAQKLLETQCAVWQQVDKLFQNARCMVAFLSNSQF
ncbi:U3 small nucleolar RNA-associated protein 21 homolog [Beta vulgaris subsp. vulgaris]|uniref:U3 small nucleolar RNA-associated protein 21 homolog n=1 Tax=Beta vulgaris subsp. vulgaris TaxID=3555 RepID=UPI002036F045|nr:U3 small nucleolar RNA-associated protein 21 homolog [Beta vulgaris subsp. vulgaris]